jgi:hypothetical protein
MQSFPLGIMDFRNRLHVSKHDTMKAYRWRRGKDPRIPSLGVAWKLLSTDHELISAKNASLVAIHGSSSGSNVRHYPT